MKILITTTGLVLWFSLFGVVSIGCKSAKAPYTPGDDLVTAETYPNIVLLTPGLERQLDKQKPTVTPARDGQPMLVRAPIRSRTDHTQHLEYRVIFFAKDQEQLTRNPVWYPLQLGPRSRQIISANSISLDAMNWELQIRTTR